MQNAYYKLIILVLMIIYVSAVKAEDADLRATEEAVIDSITYQQYLAGAWDELIETGNTALERGIDFKWLQQRMGYAWFVKGNYYNSKKHYRQSLHFDPKDEMTHLYLFYANTNTGHSVAARYHAGFLSPSAQKLNNQKAFRPLNSIDAEFSYKQPEQFYRENNLREDARYRRIGMQSTLGYRLALYQSLSGYQQKFDFVNSTNQLEYIGLLSLQVSPSVTVQGGYRYTGTRSIVEPDTFYTPGSTLIGKINYHFNRFDISGTANTLFNEYIRVNQWGIHIGTGFTGRNPVYLKSSLYRLIENGTDASTLETYSYPHTVFNQTAGILVIKQRLWAEASLTLGNLNYFTSNDGLYLYNSQDPVVFKTGGSLTAYINRHLSVSLHYGFEKKYTYSYEEYYYQQGLTGGIVWKM